MIDQRIRIERAEKKDFSACRPINFLYSEPTIEMLCWYYERDNLQVIGYDDIDERTSVVQLAETIDGYIKEMSITMGQTIKRQIYRQYMFYHPLVAKNIEIPQGSNEKTYRGGICHDL